MADTPLEIVKEAYAALLGNGDLEGFLKSYDDQSVMEEASSLPYGGTYRGRDAIRAGILRVLEYWKDFSFVVNDYTTNEEGVVIALGTFSATSVKTGKSVSFPLAEVWRFENGKTRLVMPIYSDTKAVVDALG